MSSGRKRPRGTTDTTLSSADVARIVAEIRSAPGTPKERKEAFERLYPAFAEDMPMLFEMACAPTFDQERFDYFMRMRESVLSGARSSDSASKEVGQKLFDVYVKDLVTPKK